MRIVYVFLLSEILFTNSVFASEMKFTNIRCVNFSNIIRYDVCRINAINHTTNSVTIRAELDRPVHRVELDFTVLKRANGWKRFLYEFKDFDCCAFMSGKIKNKVMEYFYGFLDKFSNMNHTCPFEGPIIFEGMILSMMNLPILPGEYGLRLIWKFEKEPAARVEGFMNYKNYRESWS